MMVSGGLALLAAFCFIGRRTSGPNLLRAARVFIPVWAIASVINLTVGVVSAGYTIAQELPILVVVFGVPATAALLIIRFTAKE
jgi:hypothetical protein